MIRIGSNIKKIAEVGVRFKGVPRSDNPAAPHDVLTMHALNTALKQIRKAVNLGNKFLWIIVINLFFVFNCYPEIPTNTPSAGILEFFKASISSHPDIESFIVSQRDIKKNKTVYFAGARSGSNFVLRVIPDTNHLFDLNQQFIFGRSADSAYELSHNAVSYGFGSNALTGAVEMNLDLTRQLLDMGVGNLQPESIKWDDKTFTAKSVFDDFALGKLELSNGFPSKLSISTGKELYKLVQYTYPEPPLSLGGFPAKMAIFRVKDGHLDEALEVIFYSIKLATNGLSADFFSASHFMGSNILHTNIHRDSDLYVQNRLGVMVKAPDSLKKSAGFIPILVCDCTIPRAWQMRECPSDFV